jgi:hypothetical protein
MEWVLQVADEFDDLIGALWLYFVGFAAEIGLRGRRARGPTTATVKSSKMAICHALSSSPSVPSFSLRRFQDAVATSPPPSRQAR